MKKIFILFTGVIGAMVAMAQNVGIGTLTPRAKLHVNDSSVLFTGGAWFLPGTPGNTPVQGSGSRMMWYADKAALRAGAVSGNAWDKDNIGKYSFAAGIDVMAQGDYSVALGVNNKSTDWYGFTAGAENTAAGAGGIAMGYNNIAKNTGSVAIGFNLIARSVYSVALGNGNDTSDLQRAIGSGDLDDRLFQIGNGSGNIRSNAVTILKNGNTGIGTLLPRARLHVDSSVVFSGQALAGNATFPAPAIEGKGTRFLWYPQKGAVRFGTIDDGPLVGGIAGSRTTNQWNRDNIGRFSFAAGFNTQASGEASTALGTSSSASGNYSLAVGQFAIASGSEGVALGTFNTASGENSVALGYFGFASGTRSTSIGSGNAASGFGATAIGFGARALANYTVSMGTNTTSFEGGGVSIGDNAIANAVSATAIGFHVTASSTQSIVTGKYNVIGLTNTLFEIGNGTADNNRQNAFTILNSGNTGIGTVIPKAVLHVAEGSVLFSNTGIASALPANPPISGSGRRMMWYADKAAFRAGYADGTQWDNVSTGDHSFAAGRSSVASASNTVALGYFNTATGLYSVSLGNSSVASGSGAIAIGSSVTASGFSATSMGYESASRALASFSMGFNTIAKSDFSFVAGKFNDTTNTNRIFEIGNGTANNARSNAVTVLNNGNVGIGTTAPQKQLDVVGGPSPLPVTLVIGNKGGFGRAALELVSDYGLSSQWRPGYIRSNDIGGFTGSLEFYTNGTGSTNLYGNVKGFEVRNGAALTASGAVGSYSDARLKNTITAFTDGLKVINQINPVQFYYNADAPFKTDQQQTGIIAQELEKAAPYMVEKNKQNGYDDLLSVNNQAYTFLLINAVKELAKQNADLIKRIEELERKLDR